MDDVDLGPQVSAGELSKTTDAIRTAVEEDASVAIGGEQLNEGQFENGKYGVLKYTLVKFVYTTSTEPPFEARPRRKCPGKS